MSFVTDKLQLAGQVINRSTQPLLRATPPQYQPPDVGARGLVGLNGLNVRSAIRFNVLDALGTPAAPMGSAQPNVGSAGSTDNAGQIAGAAGNVGYAVPGMDAVALFQSGHPGLAMALRIGLPVVGVLAWTKGHHVIGGAALVGGAALWYAKMAGR